MNRGLYKRKTMVLHNYMGYHMSAFRLFSFILISFILLTAGSSPLPLDENEISNDETVTISDPIKIGLMLSNNPVSDPTSLEALHAVQLAIEIVNREGGINGHPVEIAMRSGDGEWGIASKKSVELIFDEEVQAIIGSLDGRNAHLTQMAITKAQVVYLETRATDPTLSEINIPWFFRVIPSDRQQAEVFIYEIFQVQKMKNLSILISDTYDHQMAANTFIRKIESGELYIMNTFQFDHTAQHPDDAIQFLMKSDSEAVVYFGNTEQLKQILMNLQQSDFGQKVFMPQTLLNREEEDDSDGLYQNVVFGCLQAPVSQEFSIFRQKFRDLYGYDPGIEAVYSYDAVNLLIESIRQAGPMRSDIRDHLTRIQYSNGVTGLIRFEKNGDISPIRTNCF